MEKEVNETECKDYSHERLSYDQTRALMRLMYKKGFELPVHFALIACNGFLLTGYYYFSEEADDLDATITTKWAPEGQEGTFTLPVNVMFVDGNSGNGALLLVDISGKVKLLY